MSDALAALASEHALNLLVVAGAWAFLALYRTATKDPNAYEGEHGSR